MGRLALVCIEQPTGLALNYIMAFIIAITAEKQLYYWECETLADKVPPPFFS